MNLSMLRKFALPALLAVSLPSIGCTLEAGPPAVYAGYEPMYYDGYVVYYDSYGLPYYYVDGGTYYVPRAYGRYDILVDHYRGHRSEYR